MASRGDIVVVTINYRLSTLGFLALNDGTTNGNFGLADQIVALDWVKEYITAFGGDPDRITIAGESAGAASVCALLASPLAIGKYAGAIMESSPGRRYSSDLSIPEEVSILVEPILAEIGRNLSDALECLRAYDANTLVNLAHIARRCRRHTRHDREPADEGAAFITYPTNDNFTAELIANSTARVETEVDIRCLNQATTAFDPNHPVCDAPPDATHPYGNPSEEYFKCHTGELYFVFGTLPSDRPYRNAEDLPFMQTALDAWTAFARTYDPNPDPLYLAARGYWTAIEHIAQQGPWVSVTKDMLDTAPMRVL
ncbi:Alpha/Beta hydrolase protein [Sparassis latifolia]